MTINYEQAAARYIAMAQQNLQANNFMRAAHCFLQVGDYASAMDWFAQASLLFTSQGDIEHGLQALQSYHHLKPNDRTLAYNILKLCQEHGQAPQVLLQILSDKEDIELALRSISIFSNITDDQCDKLINSMHQRFYEDGDKIVSMGELADSLFFVMDGNLNVTMKFNDKTKQLATLSAGDFFGEMGYFIGRKRTATVKASSSVTLLELPYTAIDELQKEIPSLKENMLLYYRQRVQITRLSLTPMFSGLSLNDIEILAQHASLLRVQPGEVLFQEGDTSKGVYLIYHGNIALSTSVENDEHVVAILNIGDLVGEISLVSDGKHTTTARAVIDSTVLMFDSSDLQSVYQHSAKFRKLLSKRKKIHLKCLQLSIEKEDNPFFMESSAELQEDSWEIITRNGMHTCDIDGIQQISTLYP
ncbi:MAG: cyclic nucleotide-binding domain-containing protein [Mariprofundales bacterium]